MPVTTRRASYDGLPESTTDGIHSTPVGKGGVMSGTSAEHREVHTAPPAKRGSDTPNTVLLKRYSRHLSFNPGMLDHSRYWSEESLRDLCRKLSLESTGNRGELITRLRAWHEEMDVSGDAAVGLRSYSAPGGNFWLISVKEALVSSKFKSPFRRGSAVDGDGAVKPILRRDSAYGESPSAQSSGAKSAKEGQAKKRRSGSLEGVTESKAKRRTSICPPAKDEGTPAGLDSEASSPTVSGQARSPTCPASSASRSATTGKKRRARVQFSPYNEVQLMSPRRTYEVFATEKRLNFGPP
ncbi:hypothetical protein FOZ60_013550 [Perkinsus olseni]|uniref:SAP domain-containing protein n=1 Tax=Perkinsus olseni TaxID=32597 RepID=A0A7J6N927_PEROL|nr:hypothetical protein FOZ60_013550 [Perkinsus olseni]